MDRISDSGSDDLGSNPDGVTLSSQYSCNSINYSYIYLMLLTMKQSCYFSMRSGYNLYAIETPNLRPDQLHELFP